MDAPAWGSEPWYVVDAGYERIYVRDCGGLIADHQPPWRYEGQDERYVAELARYKARAHLIAAAPDLYDALAALVDAEDRAEEITYDQLKTARAALRRAKEAT